MMRTLLAVVGAVLLWLPASAGTDEDARVLIEKTVMEVLGILGDEERSVPERRAALEALAHERFDFRTMSRLVLARNWKRLTPEQQVEFVAQFQTYLAND